MIDLRLGDCLEVMKGMDANSVDAVVCDPPYGLEFMGKEWDKLTRNCMNPQSEADQKWNDEHPSSMLQRRMRDRPDIGATAKYRNEMQSWHYTWAVEALRVAKPGAHLLAFGGTRTHHRLACAIEDAGWEIRDTVMWVYGSGFPKSHDVSKAIDKMNGRKFDDRFSLGKHIREKRESLGISRAEVNGWINGVLKCEHYESESSDFARVPTLDDWNILKDRLGLSDEWTEFVKRIEAEREIIGKKNGNLLAVAPGQNNDRSQTLLDITSPSTPEAQEWQGWGTALKPAWEPVIVARKPVNCTVAENVLKWGTGAMNIDACRIEGIPPSVPEPIFNSPTGKIYGFKTGEGRNGKMSHAVGRWPANLIHDGSDEVMELFPQTTTGNLKPHQQNSISDSFGMKGKYITGSNVGDSGSASRFFYCAKASKRDRDEGLEGMEERIQPSTYGDIGPMDGNPRKVDTGHIQKIRNHHPTVKPTALMQYLCRLVTPPGGVILDPFMGSGSTGKAAVLEGFNFIGIELDPEYYEIAEKRIAKAQEQPKLEI